MPIEVMCVSCGKRYCAPDSLAGKRLPCKSCGATIAVPAGAAGASGALSSRPQATRTTASAATVLKSTAKASPKPAPGPTSHDDVDFDAFAALSDGGEPIELAEPAPGTRAARREAERSSNVPPPPPPPALSAGIASLTARLPAWAGPLAARIARHRPRTLWGWAVAIPLALMVIGYVHPTPGFGVMIILAVLGAVVIAGAVVWGVIQAVVLGSRAIIGVFVAAPLLGIPLIIKAFNRANRRESSRAAFSEASLPTLIGGLAAGFAVIALVVGLVTRPRAFRVPFLVSLLGVMMLILSSITWMVHFSTPRHARYADDDAGGYRPSTPYVAPQMTYGNQPAVAVPTPSAVPRVPAVAAQDDGDGDGDRRPPA